MWRKTAAAAALAAAGLALAAAPAPVSEALQRPAQTLREPTHAVLLSAARAGSRLVAVGERGVVLLSDDGANSWRQARVPTSVTLTSVCFADERRGWAAGHGGVVLATDDGGERWELRLDGRMLARLASQQAADARAQQEAERLQTDGPDKPWLDLACDASGRLRLVGAHGLALASDDGGQRWLWWATRLPNPNGLHLYAFRQRGERVVIAGEQGLVLFSDDGGARFRRLTLPYAGSFFVAELPSGAEIVVGGLRGQVWRSGDGGRNWSPAEVPAPESLVASSIGGDGRVYLLTEAGRLWRQNGPRFEPVAHGPLPLPAGLLPMDGGDWLVLTARGPLRLAVAREGA